MDEHLHLRVDTRYAVYFVDIDKVPSEKKEYYESKGTSLQRHPISVFSDPKNRKKSQITVASKYMLHSPNLDAITSCKTKEQKQCVIIEDYLKTMKSTKERLEMIRNNQEGERILNETYTATGHDYQSPIS